MQTLAAPIGGREQRRDHLVPYRRACLVILIVQRMRHEFGAEIRTVPSEFFFRQGFRPAHEFAVNTAALAALAGAVLNGLDLHVVPVFPKGRENAAVMRHVAIPVGSAFPDEHGRQMRRLQGSDMPLLDAVIGYYIVSN